VPIVPIRPDDAATICQRAAEVERLALALADAARSLRMSAEATASKPTAPKDLICVQEVEERLDLSHATVHALIFDGTLASRKQGRRRLVNVESVTEYARACRSHQAS